MDNPDWVIAYEALRDQFGLTDDAIGAFAIQLRFNLDDLKELSAEAIVGGGQDKKCDVFYLDRELGIVCSRSATMHKLRRKRRRPTRLPTSTPRSHGF